MKPSDVFGIIVRTIGVIILVYAAWYMLYAFLEAGGIIQEEIPQEIEMYFASGVGSLVVGIVLLRGAAWFVRFSYPNVEAKDSTEVPTAP